MVVPAVRFFCVTVLFDWLGIGWAKGGIPSTMVEWLVVIGAAAAEAAIFTLLFHAVLGRFAKRSE
jgi:hypothetical protein